MPVLQTVKVLPLIFISHSFLFVCVCVCVRDVLLDDPVRMFNLIRFVRFIFTCALKLLPKRSPGNC